MHVSELENSHSHKQCINQKLEHDLSFLTSHLNSIIQAWAEVNKVSRTRKETSCSAMGCPIILGILYSVQKANTVKENAKENNVQSEMPRKVMGLKNASNYQENWFSCRR